MAKHVGANSGAQPRTHFDLLPDLRRRHGIFPAARPRRVQTELRRRCGIFRNDDVDPGNRRLRTLRNLELAAARFSLGAQSRLLVGLGLSRRRPERFFPDRNEPLAKRFALSPVIRCRSFWQIDNYLGRAADTGDETRRKNRSWITNTRRGPVKIAGAVSR